MKKFDRTARAKMSLSRAQNIFMHANETLLFYYIIRSDEGLTLGQDSTIRELKQTRGRRKRERHLKMWLRVSAIIFQLFKLIMFEKCVLTIQELNWNQRLGHKKTKLNNCHHMLTLSTQLQNRSFPVVERTRTSSKRQKMKNARAKRAKIQLFIVKYENLRSCCTFALGSSFTTAWLTIRLALSA